MEFQFIPMDDDNQKVVSEFESWVQREYKEKLLTRFQYIYHIKKDLRNIIECYLDSMRCIKSTRDLFRERYGTNIHTKTVTRALDVFRLFEEENQCDQEICPEVKTEMETITCTDLEDINFIKLEMFDPDQENTYSNVYSQYESHNSLEHQPFIYTTRLDDMLIFKKDFKNLDIDDIVQNVIHESKPKLEELPCRETKRTIPALNSFLKLVLNINTFNELVNEQSPIVEDVFPANIPSRLPQCKPLFVVLEDCKIKPGQTVTIETDPHNYNIKVLRIKELNWREEAFSSIGPGISVYDRVKLLMNKCNHLILRNNTNAEMYIFNKSPIPTFYLSFNYLPKDKIPPDTVIVMNNCCWIAREKYINNIELPENTKYKVNTSFIRTPHKCTPDACSCCCKTPGPTHCSSPKTYILPNIALANYGTPEWLNKIMKSLNSKSQTENCTSIAVGYNRNKRIHSDLFWSKINDQTLSLSEIQAKNFFKKTPTDELYTVHKHKKLVIKYVEQKASKIDFFSESRVKACCWAKQEWILSTQVKHHENVKCFIKSSHPCSVNNCKCCCRYLIMQKNLNLFSGSKDYGIPKKIVRAIDYNNKAFQLRKQIGKNPKSNDQLTYSSYSEIELPSSSKSNLPSKLRKSQAKNMPSTKAGLTRDRPMPLTQSVNPPTPISIITNTVNSVRPASEITNSVHAMPLKQLLTSNDITQPPVTMDNIMTNTDPAVSSMVQTILDRFREVHLTITPDGDVSAELSTPINDLSTAELKILSAILAHAKQQVKALKSNPGTVYNMNDMPGMAIRNPIDSNASANSDAMFSKSSTPFTSSASITQNIPNVPDLSEIPIIAPVVGSIAPTGPGALTESLIVIAPPEPIITNNLSYPIISSVASQAAEPTASGLAYKSSTESASEDSSSTDIPDMSSLPKIASVRAEASLPLESNPKVPSRRKLRKYNRKKPIPPEINTTNAFQFYTNITALKANQYYISCQNYLSKKMKVITPTAHKLVLFNNNNSVTDNSGSLSVKRKQTAAINHIPTKTLKSNSIILAPSDPNRMLPHTSRTITNVVTPVPSGYKPDLLKAGSSNQQQQMMVVQGQSVQTETHLNKVVTEISQSISKFQGGDPDLIRITLLQPMNKDKNNDDCILGV